MSDNPGVDFDSFSTKMGTQLRKPVPRQERKLRKKNIELEDKSIRDDLTGLYNRRYFNQRLEHEEKKLKETNKPYAVAIADLDFFKEVNDTQGHAAGDAVLKAISRELVNSVRLMPNSESDLVARLGGEEFGILLVDINKEDLKKRAEEIKENIANLRIRLSEESVISKTISIGVGIREPGDKRSVEEFVKSVDDALYNAKDNGRNQVVVAE